MYRPALAFVLIMLASLLGAMPVAAQQVSPFLPLLVYCPSGTFADCVGSPCTMVDGKYSCKCTVKSGPSGSAGSCIPQNQQSIQSRYYPMTAYQVCSRAVASWANCLGSPCTISDNNTAICNCSTATPPQNWIVPLPSSSCNPSVCSQPPTISTAAPSDAADMTKFLIGQNRNIVQPKVCTSP
jgi:hypothetical protein